MEGQLNPLDFIIMHCSASRFGNVELITKWHQERGMRTIGYHFVILNAWPAADRFDRYADGNIEPGRPMDDDNFITPDEVGAHTLGYNARSIGICIIGENKFSTHQMQSARALVRTLVYKHKIPWDNVLGHCETESGKAEGKTCPNIDMNWFRAYASI